MSYLKRESAKLNYSKTKNLVEYFENYKENESTELAVLYNEDRVESSILDILNKRSISIDKSLCYSGITLDIINKNGILNRLEKYSKHEKKLVHLLDEEQEVELEIEQEEEREVQRPLKAESIMPVLDEDVQLFVTEGIFKPSSCFISLSHTLSNSSFYNLAQNEAWMQNNLYATQDFFKTIKNNGSNKDDDFLRPCRWLAFTEKQKILVLLSGYEANELMSHFTPNKISLVRSLPRMRREQKLKINFQNVKIPVDLFQPMAIFAGNLYLNSLEEQESYLNFIGYRPLPRTREEQTLFEDEKIRKNGFVPYDYRKYIEGLSLTCEFKEDPNKLIQKVIEIRNYSIVPDSAHHNCIFLSGKKP